jgi:glutathione S-transferase
MSDVVLHTDPLSPYGWAARLIAAEKGVACRVVPVDPTAQAHRRLHPFGKMPVLEHGAVLVFETLAIAHYLDRAFDGPPLQPANVLEQTTMLRWISIVSSYGFPVMNGLFKERAAGAWRAEPPDEAVIAAFVPPLALQLRLIDEAVAGGGYLAGDGFTLADAFLAPLLHLAAFTPEGAAGLAGAPAASDWLERMRARPSFVATNPLAMAAA